LQIPLKEGIANESRGDRGEREGEYRVNLLINQECNFKYRRLIKDLNFRPCLGYIKKRLEKTL
jgi:hypothetical protein